MPMNWKVTTWIALSLVLGLCPTASSAEPSLLVLKTAVEIPADYTAVIKKAGRAKASLVVLPLRRSTDGHEGAFEFAEFASLSGLFAKVSVGDDLGKADYAVTGAWNAWSQMANGDAGMGRWMRSFATLKMDLLFEGSSIGMLEAQGVAAELYLNPPFMPLQLVQAGHTGLYQVYQLALYRLAKDILKRSAA